MKHKSIILDWINQERFWGHVHKGHDCWTWTASISGTKGYGQCSLKYPHGDAFAHRVSWVLHNGPIPERMLVLHQCNNSKCVRPDHLFLAPHMRERRPKKEWISRSPAYMTYRAMKVRCLNPSAAYYEDYGGRGIKICDRWLDSFENFLEDMGERPPGLSLDRRDNNGNYCKENCKWSTRTEQNNNKRSNRNMTVGGVTLSVAQWAKKTGLSEEMIRKRLNLYGWSPERIISTPSRIHPKPKTQSGGVDDRSMK